MPDPADVRGPMPLRPIGTAELLDTAVRLVRRNARASFTLSFPIALVRTLFAAAVSYAGYTASVGTQLTLVAGLTVAGSFGTVLTGLLAPVFAADLTGRRVTAGEAVRGVGAGVIGLIVIAVVATVAQGVGLLVLAVGGIWLWGIWAVVAPARVLERTGVRAAFGRSFQLVRTRFWNVWGVRALGWVLTSLLGTLVSLPLTAVAASVLGANPFDMTSVPNPGLYVTFTSIGTLLAAGLTAPITSAIDVLIYTDLRMRREGMDIVMALPAAPAVAPQPVSAR